MHNIDGGSPTPVELIKKLAPDAKLIDLEITKALGPESLSFINKTLCSFWSEEIVESFGLLEKIDLFLTLAGKEKILLPAKLLKAVKDVNKVLPSQKLDTRYLSSIESTKRKYFFQLISTLAVLMSFSLAGVKSVIDLKKATETRNSIELSSSESDQKQIEKLEAQAKFERLYNEDLATVVAEIGWSQFLKEYASLSNPESLWSSQEVFQLLLTQNPRYWGEQAIWYPEIFSDTLAHSSITLQQFMSSCDSANFFAVLNQRPGWLDLWSIEELFTTLKTINPDWATVVINNQKLFTGHLTRADLSQVVAALNNNAAIIKDFMDDYDDATWSQSWSKRELLDEIKRQSPMPEWDTLVAIDFFAAELTTTELEEIVKYIATLNNNGTVVPADESSKNLFDNYYKLEFYNLIDPDDFVALIEQNFSETVAAQIFIERPAINDLKHQTVGELFDTQAIGYVLANYAEWKAIYPAEAILEFLRASTDYGNYFLIAAYPEVFQQTPLTDNEVDFLVFRQNPSTDDYNYDFLLNFAGDSGWQTQASPERLMKIGRTTDREGLSMVALAFPEFFLPYFNDEDFCYLAYHMANEMKQQSLLTSTDPLWQGFITAERRRFLLDQIMKQSEKFSFAVLNLPQNYLFTDVLTFAEQQELMRMGYSADLRATPTWKANTTLAGDYAFFKSMSPDVFAQAMASDPTEFGTFLTEEDLTLILALRPDDVMRDYRIWKDRLSPEFMLDFWQSSEMIPNYGATVISNQHIFGHLLYDEVVLKNVLSHGGAVRFFEWNSETGAVYYKAWLEVFTIEELFTTLKTFDAGKIQIIKNPDLFFELVDASDLDSYLAVGDAALLQLSNEAAWQELWSYEQLYKAAKKNHVSSLAATIFVPELRENYLPHVEPGDLALLIDSYDESNAGVYSFSSQIPVLLEKWSLNEIIEALKKYQPQEWGNYLSSIPEYSSAVIDRQDLAELIQYGAEPLNLGQFGLWTEAELLDSYQQNRPETWGAVILANPEFFRAEVAARKIPLKKLLASGGAEVIGEFLSSWQDSVWTKAEIEQAINEMNLTDEPKGG